MTEQEKCFIEAHPIFLDEKEGYWYFRGDCGQKKEYRTRRSAVIARNKDAREA